MEEFPPELLFYIIQYLPVPDIVRLSMGCKRFNLILDKDSSWKYYFRRVSKDFIIHPELMYDEMWKMAYIKNKSIVFPLCEKDKGWLIEHGSLYYSYYQYKDKIIPVLTPESFSSDGECLGYSSTHPRVYDLLPIKDLVGYPYHHQIEILPQKLIIQSKVIPILAGPYKNSNIRLTNSELRFTPGLAKLLDETELEV